LNDDFLDMLSALSGEGTRFLIVGAYAMAHYGLPRATGDIDIWVGHSPENADRVWEALRRFGAPLDQVAVDDFGQPDLVLQIGVAPSRIDLLTSIDGVDFEEAWAARVEVDIGGIRVAVLSRTDLMTNKRAAGRPQDLADLAWLEREAEGRRVDDS